MDILIRDAAASDLDALEGLEKACFSDPWSREVFAAQLPDERHEFLVAECGGRLLGYVTMMCVLDEGDISNVAVEPGARRNGIGRELVAEMLRRAAVRLRDSWIVGEEQELEEQYKEPDFVIPFDYGSFSGDAYPVNSWAVCAVEVEVDMLTGKTVVLNAVGNFDVGTPIDRRIVLGQMEGGIRRNGEDEL